MEEQEEGEGTTEQGVGTTEQDSLLLMSNLLQTVICNILYIKGLFTENYFKEESVPSQEMKFMKLMPIDAESQRIIDWIEKGMYDALRKKYLKKLSFCFEDLQGTVVEDYCFSFDYGKSTSDEVSISLGLHGSKKTEATFKSNAMDINLDQMRSSACKMVQTLVHLMQTLEWMPEEGIISMKPLYYGDAIPTNHEPPVFWFCPRNETNNTNKNALEMNVGDATSEHKLLNINVGKVESILDPCKDENYFSHEDEGLSLEVDSLRNDGSSSEKETLMREGWFKVNHLKGTTVFIRRYKNGWIVMVDSRVSYINEFDVFHHTSDNRLKCTLSAHLKHVSVSCGSVRVTKVIQSKVRGYICANPNASLKEIWEGVESSVKETLKKRFSSTNESFKAQSGRLMVLNRENLGYFMMIRAKRAVGEAEFHVRGYPLRECSCGSGTDYLGSIKKWPSSLPELDTARNILWKLICLASENDRSTGGFGCCFSGGKDKLWDCHSAEPLPDNPDLYSPWDANPTRKAKLMPKLKRKPKPKRNPNPNPNPNPKPAHVS